MCLYYHCIFMAKKRIFSRNFLFIRNSAAVKPSSTVVSIYSYTHILPGFFSNSNTFIWQYFTMHSTMPKIPGMKKVIKVHNYRGASSQTPRTDTAWVQVYFFALSSISNVNYSQNFPFSYFSYPNAVMCPLGTFQKGLLDIYDGFMRERFFLTYE